MRHPAIHHETPEATTCSRRVLDLVTGDVIVADGSMPLRVTDVSDVMHGRVIIGYVCGPNDSLADHRTYLAGEIVHVHPAGRASVE